MELSIKIILHRYDRLHIFFHYFDAIGKMTEFNNNHSTNSSFMPDLLISKFRSAEQLRRQLELCPC